MIDCNQVERVLRALAPQDLAPHPLYICTDSQGAPRDRVTASDKIAAQFGVSLDLALKDWLTEKGRWRGRGPAIYIRTDYLQREIRPECRKMVTLCCCVHECGHILQQEIQTADEDRTEEQVRALATFSDIYSDMIRSKSSAPISVPWFGHDASFVRNLLHLHYRAQRLDYDLPLDVLHSTEPTELQPIEDYQEALSDEPADMVAASFRTIRETPPPRPFVELFMSDVRRWIYDNPKMTQNATRQAVDGLRLYEREPVA